MPPDFPRSAALPAALNPHAAVMQRASVGINPYEELFSNIYYVKKIKQYAGSG
ncbi:hypothetical protein [Cupriavidus taiwanensis]|uniref:hypothetical protein n=1 Tax=Cupriavidus taiwanensis TaxID=164546 RepID=UPI0015F2681C|nr:hypothetical protein [Cupriavidus taiwanensis]